MHQTLDFDSNYLVKMSLLFQTFYSSDITQTLLWKDGKD